MTPAPKVLFLCTGLAHSSATRRIRDAKINGIDLVIFNNSEDKVRSSIWRRVFSLLYVRMAIFIIQNPADAIWCWGHDAGFLASTVSIFFNRGRVVWDVSDIGAYLLGPGYLRALLRALETFLIRRATALFLTSQRFYDEYYFQKIDLEKVHVIENKWEGTPIASPLFSADGPRIRVVYVGLFRTAFVVRTIRNLAARLSEHMEFWFIGVATEPDIIAELELAKRLDNVVHTGPFDHGDIALMYKGASLVWGIVDPDFSPNERWLLPNRVYDGIATGVPLLCTAGTASGDYAISKGAGIALPLDEELIYNCLLELATDRQKLLELANAMPSQHTAYLEGEYAAALEAVAAK